MFPLYDEYKIPGKIPWITFLLVLSNILVFLFVFNNLDNFVLRYGLIPALFLKGREWANLFTALFLHANFWHLFGNMWFLFVFGRNVEKKIGSLRFLSFYLTCGVFAAFAYSLLTPHQLIPVIGASGAISGVLGAYLVLFPRHRIVSLVPIFFFVEFVAVPVFIFVMLWFLFQLLYIGAPTNIAYWAHLAGFLGGIFFIRFFARKRKKRLFSFYDSF
jgi:hypothetical protein